LDALMSGVERRVNVSRMNAQGRAMQRAAIPAPPLVVGGMLGKQDTKSPRLKKLLSPSRHSVLVTDATHGPAIQRLLSDPPDLSYRDQNLSANGL
jgi:hypothetical protein